MLLIRVVLNVVDDVIVDCSSLPPDGCASTNVVGSLAELDEFDVASFPPDVTSLDVELTTRRLAGAFVRRPKPEVDESVDTERDVTTLLLALLEVDCVVIVALIASSSSS